MQICMVETGRFSLYCLQYTNSNTYTFNIMPKILKQTLSLLTIMLLPLAAVYAQDDISDEELNKFADAVMAVQINNQQAQQQMIAIIQKEGLEIDRFVELQEAAENPEIDSKATKKEMEQFNTLIEKIDKIQPELEQRAEEGIKTAGLSTDRFQELAAIVQQDETLQQRFQTLIMKKMGGGGSGH